MKVDPHTRFSTAPSTPAAPTISAPPAAAPSSSPIPRAISLAPRRQAQPVPEGTIYTCPMHPRDPSGRPGLVPHLRHGARARTGDGRDRTQSRARRHEAPVLDRPRSHASCVRARDGRPSRWRTRLPAAADLQLDSARPRHAGRAVGRAGRSSSAPTRRF